MKNKKLQLFLSFFKIGAFTFGGGLAMIPLIQKEAVDVRGWVSEDDVLEIAAIAESTPGPIAINAATFIGYKTAGFWGAFCATFGVVFPSFVIIYLLATLVGLNSDLKVLNDLFFGIRAGVLAILIRALLNMFKKSPKGIYSYIVMLAVFFAVGVLKLNVFIAMILCALSGVLYSFYQERRMKNDLS